MQSSKLFDVFTVMEEQMGKLLIQHGFKLAIGNAVVFAAGLTSGCLGFTNIAATLVLASGLFSLALRAADEWDCRGCN